MPKFDVLTIGPAFIDMFIDVDDEYLASKGMEKARSHRINRQQLAEIIKERPPYMTAGGGCSTNTAFSMASLGLKTAWSFKLTDDEFGRAFVKELNDYGIYFNTPFTESEEGTGSCIIFLTPDGERTMCPYFGSQADYSADDVDEDIIKDSKVLYIAGCSLDDKTNAAVKKAFTLAKKHGVITTFNAFDVKSLKAHRAFFEDLIEGGLVDILFGNEAEMKTLFEKEDSDELFEFLRTKPFTVVITRDKNGAVVVSKGKVTKIPCTPIEHIVDATGAGDSFVAGYLYAFCNGKDEYTCGKKGNEVASVTVMQKGARPVLTDEQKKFD